MVLGREKSWRWVNAFVQRSRALSGNFMAEECYLGSPENTLGRVDEDTLGFKSLEGGT
jgi:hypothetical protein